MDHKLICTYRTYRTYIMDHIYNTEAEAQIAANWLGCLGTHTHIMKGKKIFMPCQMQ